jgi:asparagine synthase (glutamine-hydrolysing)
MLLEEGKCLHAFAVISDDAGINRETSHISSVLGQGNLQPHIISQTELLCRMDELVRAIEAEGEPFDCLMNLNRAVYLHAQDQNMTALLDGVDGDILLSGSGHLTQLCRQAAFRTLLEETWQADGLTAEYRLGKKLLFSSLLSMGTLLAPDWMRRLRRQLRPHRGVETAIRESIIAPDFANWSHLEERFARLDSHSPRPASLRQQEFHRIALDHPFLTVGLERYERVASAFGIEARHPFTDVRLAEFCLNLPWHLKTRRGWTKLILRRAMEPCLPADVVWRKDKDSLMWEMNRLVLKARAEYFYQLTLDEETSLKPYVETAKLMSYWQEYLTEGDETHASLIWSGIALALWLRRHRNMIAGWKQAS